MRYIDYARLRNYDIKNLLQYELTTTSFSLTKEGYLRKPQKSDLSTELKRLLSGRCLASLPAVVDKRMLIIDFMAYARKVPVKKANLKTFLDFLEHLWSTFTDLSKGCTRIDIIFDLYHNKASKEASAVVDVSQQVYLPK